MSFLEYILTGISVILLVMYVIRVRMDNHFRKRMIPILKKQKADIEGLEKVKNDMTAKTGDLDRELNKLKTGISGQKDEYSRIGFILSNGLFDRVQVILEQPTLRTRKAKTGVEGADREDLSLQNQVIKWWFDRAFVQQEIVFENIELTDLIRLICGQLNAEFKSRNLTFIHHISEPVMVDSNREAIKYIILTYGRLLGHRAGTGSTLYLDTDKTGKKCLISLEDASPGDNDLQIKSMFAETWLPGELPDAEPQRILPVILSGELIKLNRGNVWLGKIQEIGMKITFSVPLHL